MLRPEDKYPGRTGTADADYPDGSYQDESTPGMNNGTPLQEDWANDREGFRQGIVRTVGSTPNGVIDTAIQSQAIEAVLSNALGHTRPRGMGPASLCAGLHLAENIAFPGVSPNISADLASDPRDMCVAWDYTKDRPYLIVATNNDLYPVPCWDYSTTPALGTALTHGLTNPDFNAIACDGSAVYVDYQANGSGNARVAKFPLPWTGVADWDVDTLQTDTSTDDELVIADDDNIALMTATSGTNWSLNILAKTDGTRASGTGNDPGHNMPDKARITSNGDHIFWIEILGANSYICSASIANPSISSYTVKTISGLVSNACDIQALNADTIAVVSEATSSYPSILYSFHLAADRFASVGSFTNPASDDPGDKFYPRLCCDGLNLNVSHAVIDAAGDKTTVIRPVNATRLGPHMDVGDIAAPLTALGCTNVATDDSALSHMVFDGRDIWLYFRDVTAFNLYRIQAPGLRGV